MGDPERGHQRSQGAEGHHPRFRPAALWTCHGSTSGAGSMGRLICLQGAVWHQT